MKENTLIKYERIIRAAFLADSYLSVHEDLMSVDRKYSSYLC